MPHDRRAERDACRRASSPSAGCGRAASPSPRARGRTSGRSAGRSRNARSREVSSRSITAQHPRAGRTRSCTAPRCRRAHAASGERRRSTRVRDIGDPRRGPSTTRLASSVESVFRRSRCTKRSRPSAAAWRSRASSQTEPSASRAPHERRGRGDLRCDGALRSLRTGPRHGRGGARRPRSAAAASGAAPGRPRPGRRSRRRACAVAAGAGCSLRETRAISASVPTEPQTSLPRS